MSKNLTRKGIALGALVALGSSVIAGTPALAAGELNVVPSAGTSYNALAGTIFNLKTTFAPGFTPSSYAQLKYQVKTDANSAINYSLSSAAALDATATNVAVSTTAVSGSTANASATTVNYIGLSAATTSVTSSVEVTAFVDANNDNALSAGEWNTVRTVTFKKVADVTPVVTVTQPITGDTTAKATVNWGDLNVEQISRSAAFGVATGSTNSSLGLEIKVGSGSYAPATYSNGVFSASVSALASAAVVTAQAVYATNTYDGTANPVTNTYSSTALGTAATGTATARTISDSVGLVANVLKGNDATATAATTMVTNTAAVVRTNGTFTAQVKAFDRATTPAALAGVAVTATVATNNSSLRPASTGVTEISITVNGTKYTTNASLSAATFALTTNASGLADVVVSSVGLSANNTVTVTFAAQNLSAAVVATQTDATYTVTDDAGAAVVATNKNTAVTYNLSVKDQFGVASARTNERVEVITTQTSGTFANQYVAVSAGKVSFSVTPGTDLTGDVTVEVNLQTSAFNASTGATTWTANGTDIANRTIKVRSAAYSFSTAPAAGNIWNGSASAAYNATTNATQPITQTAVADLAAPSGTAATATWATVTLTGSNAGEKLTASGTGLILSIDGSTPAAGSATAVAQGTAVTIYVASNISGAKTLTVSNGTVSATVALTFGAAAGNTGTAVAITAPATVVPGQTFTVTGKVTDKWGNAVASASPATFAVTYTGPGFVVGGSLPTSTNASGEFSFQVLTGAADSGSATVTATYDADGTGTTSAAVAKSATIAIAAPAAPEVKTTIVGVTKAVRVRVENAKGEEVEIMIGNKTVRVATAGTNSKLWVINTTKGKKSVKVYVDGDLVAVKTVTVK